VPKWLAYNLSKAYTDRDFIRKSMKIEQILKSIEHNIGEVGNFLWTSLGQAKIWDIKNIEGTVIGTFIANKDGEVLEVDFDHTYGEEDIFYRWIKPSVKFAYLAEYNEKARSSQKFVELEDELDCLEKVNAVVNVKSFDGRVVTPINLSDEDFLLIAKMAHASNITFNDQVNVILQNLVDTYGEPKNALPHFGDLADPQVTHVAVFKEKK
jgi:hypothetical protein